MIRALAALTLALAALPALAAPIVIRDTRVTDLGTTPVLGRGYSLSTNTFQSACLRDVVVTAPSYDFQYVFKELDSEKASSSTTSVSAQGSYSSWWISAHAAASRQAATQRKVNIQNVLVTLNMDTYYASVNEAGTPLSDSAAALLQREDVPGFFAACGAYYVRGITRNAQFVSVFTYESQTTQRDRAFEAELSAHLHGFMSSKEGSMSAAASFSKRASQMNLTITSRGWGLGKNEDASLISYDLDTFKVAVKQAFISMQNPLTGRITSIEIIPWVENTDFQTRLDLNAKDVVSGRVVPLYEKKDILSMNGEFLTEMERSARARLASYYQAKTCNTTLAVRFTDDGKTVLPAYKDAKLKNHRIGPDDKAPLTLPVLAKAVDDGAQRKIWDEYQKFAYSGSPSMTKCIEKLFADPNVGQTRASAAAAGAGPAVDQGVGRGIFLRRYTEIDECTQLQAQFVPPKQPFEDYCMPEPVDL
jgi:hypothetical protein